MSKKLTKRLQTIANIVSGNIICDIGCDHGYLTEYLLEKKLIEFAYISDISKGSLKKAEDLLVGRFTNYRSLCSDGLLEYKGIDNIDQCIIAGMGGNEIISIIKNSPISIDSYILSPQHNVIDVKKYMLSIGYNINFDIIIKDKHKFYTIFKCDKSDNIQDLSEYNLCFGRDNFVNKTSDISEYIDYELNKCGQLIDKVDEKTRKNIEEKCKLLYNAKKELDNYE